MPKLKDFLQLVVPEYIPMAITTALVGSVATIGTLPGLEFLLVALVLIFIVSAFNSFNAIADKEIDRINKPERPIPSKKINDNQALWFAIVLYVLALILSFSINIEFFIVSFIAVIITTAYSYPKIDLKKKFFIGNFTVTIFYAILCSLAGWALYPTQAIPIPIISFLFLIGLSLSISKDFMDMPGDAFYKVKSLPVKLGKTQSIALIFALLVFSYFFLFFLIIQQYLTEKYFFLFIFFPLMLFNVNAFRNHTTTYTNNKIFLKTVSLIILLEITIIILELI